ncbi:hypothetical protein SRABI134_04893 [Peribacillus sp. Bi134]|nr:hypothetical protein SRABI134_04893 [Peribacillus sp. Bi134]
MLLSIIIYLKNILNVSSSITNQYTARQKTLTVTLFSEYGEKRPPFFGTFLYSLF